MRFFEESSKLIVVDDRPPTACQCRRRAHCGCDGGRARGRSGRCLTGGAACRTARQDHDDHRDHAEHPYPSQAQPQNHVRLRRSPSHAPAFRRPARLSRAGLTVFAEPLQKLVHVRPISSPAGRVRRHRTRCTWQRRQRRRQHLRSLLRFVVPRWGKAAQSEKGPRGSLRSLRRDVRLNRTGPPSAEGAQTEHGSYRELRRRLRSRRLITPQRRRGRDRRPCRSGSVHRTRGRVSCNRNCRGLDGCHRLDGRRGLHRRWSRSRSVSDGGRRRHGGGHVGIHEGRRGGRAPMPLIRENRYHRWRGDRVGRRRPAAHRTHGRARSPSGATSGLIRTRAPMHILVDEHAFGWSELLLGLPRQF